MNRRDLLTRSLPLLGTLSLVPGTALAGADPQQQPGSPLLVIAREFRALETALPTQAGTGRAAALLFDDPIQLVRGRLAPTLQAGRPLLGVSDWIDFLLIKDGLRDQGFRVAQSSHEAIAVRTERRREAFLWQLSLLRRHA